MKLIKTKRQLFLKSLGEKMTKNNIKSENKTFIENFGSNIRRSD